jgi:methyl-accepting chemotaxis protein
MLSISAKDHNLTPGAVHPSSRHRVWKGKGLAVIFLLMAVLAIAVNVKFIWDLTGEHAAKVVVERVNEKRAQGTYPNTDSLIVAEALRMGRDRLVTILLVLLVCFGTATFLLFRKLVMPLQEIGRAAKEIASGNLGVTVGCTSRDGMLGLGQSINDVAANFQEVLLFTGTIAGKVHSTIALIKNRLKENPDSESLSIMKEDLQDIKTNMEVLTNMVEGFDFYHTSFDGRKVVSKQRRSND